MIDLAYSSVFFNDKELAQEVMELQERVEYLRTMLQMHTAIAVRDAKEAEEMMGVMKLEAFIESISETAGDIAHVVFLGLADDTYIIEALGKIRERITKTQIIRKSILIGKKLSTLKLEANIGVNVMTIKRGTEIITNPEPKFVLQDGDILIARGSDIGIFELDKLAKGELTIVPRPTFDIKETHP